jgi:hypothetical protein
VAQTSKTESTLLASFPDLIDPTLDQGYASNNPFNNLSDNRGINPYNVT